MVTLISQIPVDTKKDQKYTQQARDQEYVDEQSLIRKEKMDKRYIDAEHESENQTFGAGRSLARAAHFRRDATSSDRP